MEIKGKRLTLPQHYIYFMRNLQFMIEFDENSTGSGLLDSTVRIPSATFLPIPTDLQDKCRKGVWEVSLGPSSVRFFYIRSLWPGLECRRSIHPMARHTCLSSHAAAAAAISLNMPTRLYPRLHAPTHYTAALLGAVNSAYDRCLLSQIA